MMLNVVPRESRSRDVAPSGAARPDRGNIEIDNVSVEFVTGRIRHSAVSPTTLTIPAGEFVCLLGPSGCGKSTLLNVVAGHVKPRTGRVVLDGSVVSGPGPDRGVVFQHYSLFPWRTVQQNIAFGPLMAGKSAKTADKIAREFLELVGLSKFADRYPAELSGGMQQRVGIARALANAPRVLLMDEPFGALDSQTRVMMQESLLKIWAEFRTTVLFVTHDIDEAVFLSDRVLLMSAAPGSVIDEVTINLPRPRNHGMALDASFIALKRRCFERIRQESIKAFEQQNQ
jgi:NitT/TauT family transport system ATP-binding protein